MRSLEVTYREIERLGPLELTHLLRRLLHLECQAHGVPSSSVSVSLKINEPDQGEDGRVQWDGGPERMDRIPSRFTLFQSKAKAMSKKDCEREVRVKKRKELKPKVGEVLNAGGTYVLFCGRAFKDKESRIKGLREGLKNAQRPDWQTAKMEVYDGEAIAEWANKFLPAVTFIHETLGLSVPYGLKTWRFWCRYNGLTYDYACNETLKEYIETLRRQASKERTVTRVIGLSGLGKTRLALEAFRPPTDSQEAGQQILSDSTLYYDAGFGGEVVSFVADMCNAGRCGVLVVDDCPLELHRKLAKEVSRTDSRFAVVTLDFELAKPDPGTEVICLKQDDCKGVVRSIVQQAYPGLQDPVVSKIELFAQDFPQLAVLLAESVHEGVADIGRLPPKGIVEKLLWGRDEPPLDEEKVITACSLVSHFMFSSDSPTEHMDALAGIAEVPTPRLHEVCRKFIDRGVIQRAGKFARVSPPPLAITLADRWWSSTMTNQAKDVMSRLAQCGLINEFCEQVGNLHFSQRARELTAELCGVQGLFGNAEVLNSEEGSRLFREFVKVSPQATLDALQRVFSGWNRQQLLTVGPGRRYIVWSLEDLCWWPETFGKSARLLLRFAAAENETWGNNATGVFLQLFHAYLPGTLADLKDRVKMIKDALTSDILEERTLGVRALGCALHTGPFSRQAGVESQGSRIPMRDYAPSRSEVHEYWKECIALMVTEACGDPEISALARHEFGTRIRFLISRGMLEEIGEGLERIISVQRQYWPEAVSALRDVVDYDSEGMPDDILKKIHELEEKLSALDLRERLRFCVTAPGWRHVKDESGHYVDVNIAQAQALADELGPQGDAWYDNLCTLFDGVQQKGYSFGHRLGQVTADSETFVKRAMECLKQVPVERTDPTVLGGFLDALSHNDLVTWSLDEMANNDLLLPHIVRVTTLVTPQEQDLNRLVRLAQSGKLKANDLLLLKYGDALGHIEAAAVRESCLRISTLGTDYVWSALGILFMYCFAQKERIDKCHTTLREILLYKGLLSANDVGHRDIHDWQSAVEMVFAHGRDEQFAVHVAAEIVRACGVPDVDDIGFERTMENTLNMLLRDYLEQVWSLIGDALLSKDWKISFAVRHMMGMTGEKEKGDCPFSRMPREFLMQWCENNKPEGPAIVAELMPLFEAPAPDANWHPLAKSIIDNFGDIEKVRRAIDMNIFSFMSWGSRVPYYRRRLQLVESLVDHSWPDVRKWAVGVANALRAEMRRETIEDEEERFGIF